MAETLPASVAVFSALTVIPLSPVNPPATAMLPLVPPVLVSVAELPLPEPSRMSPSCAASIGVGSLENAVSESEPPRAITEVASIEPSFAATVRLPAPIEAEVLASTEPSWTSPSPDTITAPISLVRLARPNPVSLVPVEVPARPVRSPPVALRMISPASIDPTRTVPPV